MAAMWLARGSVSEESEQTGSTAASQSSAGFECTQPASSTLATVLRGAEGRCSRFACVLNEAQGRERESRGQRQSASHRPQSLSVSADAHSQADAYTVLRDVAKGR